MVTVSYLVPPGIDCLEVLVVAGGFVERFVLVVLSFESSNTRMSLIIDDLNLRSGFIVLIIICVFTMIGVVEVVLEAEEEVSFQEIYIAFVCCEVLETHNVRWCHTRKKISSYS